MTADESPFVSFASDDGRPVFAGTSVAVSELFDHLASGGDLPEFLERFPSVSKRQADAAVVMAREAIDLVLRHPEKLRGV